MQELNIAETNVVNGAGNIALVVLGPVLPSVICAAIVGTYDRVKEGE